jgi:hypothetical protein
MSGIEVYISLSGESFFCERRARGDKMSNEGKERTHMKKTAHSRVCRVIRDYQAQYLDPISVQGGETLIVSEKVDYWNDNPEWAWVWCTDRRGKSGWVPGGAIDFDADGTTGKARYDYAAKELSVVIGNEPVVEREEGGWLWCTHPEGKSGWVPIDHVVES